MMWWRWAAAGVEALLLLILVLLWYDSLREKTGWTTQRATRAAGYAAISIPVGFLVVLVVPLWIGLILIALPALAIVAMAMAS